MDLSVQADTVIEELLESACSSIRYRIRSEILGQSAQATEMIGLQELLLQDPDIQEVLSWQQPDGWLAWDFRGSKSIETDIRILSEKGLSRHYLPLARALQALEDYPDRLDRGIGKPGRLLDELGFGGSQLIRATVCAYAGLEEKLFVQEQVTEALAGFKAVLEVGSISEIVQEYRGRLIFKLGLRWPGIYHLRLLACTRKWQTAENQAILVTTVRRLVSLSPLPDIYVRSMYRWLAAASFCMHNFIPDMQTMEDAEWMLWFHRMECLSHLGVIQAVPELKRQVERLAGALAAEEGWFKRKLNHPYFIRWDAYTDLRLEVDWRHPKCRVYDLTFRSMLILHYYESGPVE